MYQINVRLFEKNKNGRKICVGKVNLFGKKERTKEKVCVIRVRLFEK